MNQNIQQLQNLLHSHFHKSQNAQLHVGMLFDDQTYFYRYGQNQGDHKSFGIGSISKTFISSYLSKLAFEKRIDLNLGMDHYLSLNPNITYPSIKELATHTSGYTYFVPLMKTIPILLMHGFNKKNIYHALKIEWLMDYINHKQPKQNKKYRYADINYAILARIIEAIEDKPLDEVMRAFWIDEVGINDTCYANLEKTTQDKASWIWNDDNPFIASGGIFLTAQDMITYLDYQIKHHHDHLMDAHKKYVKTNKKQIYTSFSWNSFLKGNFYWHIGGQGYYRAYAGFDVKRKAAWCILATVDINAQHVGRIGSSLCRNLKRNPDQLIEFMKTYVPLFKPTKKHSKRFNQKLGKEV